MAHILTSISAVIFSLTYHVIVVAWDGVINDREIVVGGFWRNNIMTLFFYNNWAFLSACICIINAEIVSSRK